MSHTYKKEYLRKTNFEVFPELFASEDATDKLNCITCGLLEVHSLAMYSNSIINYKIFYEILITEAHNLFGNSVHSINNILEPAQYLHYIAKL